jgi:hypothetical protein
MGDRPAGADGCIGPGSDARRPTVPNEPVSKLVSPSGFPMLPLLPLLAAASVALAQPSACDCRTDLDTLVAKIERNYVGWHLEIAGARREPRFRRLVTQLRAKAPNADDVACLFLLRELTDWFHDGHLFVFEQPTIPPDEAQRRAAAAPARPLEEAALRREWNERRTGRDPIEGIWYTPGYRMAVVRSPNAREFIGVVLRSDSALWRPGQVKARFIRESGGGYRTVLLADDHTTRHLTARIYRNLLLATTPTVWGREFPLAGAEVGTLDPIDPTRPTIRLDGTDAVVVSVPSHDPRYRPVLDSLVRRYRDTLLARPVLLVDVRGDLGGGSLTTMPLVPYLVSATTRPPIGPEGPSMVVSSPDNIRYFQRGWNPDSIAERMAAAPGRVLPLLRNETLGMPFPNDSVTPNPVRVGVLMDRGVASAGEAFVLQARRSTKVTLFGENSFGVIDYQSVMVVRLACRERGILFGYPMVAASPSLPKDGLNAKGIPVDVRFRRDHGDQVAAALASLRAAR